jgi:predicted HTH transcriptional regulator
MTITKEEFEQLLEHGEDSWLDWKAEVDQRLLLDPKTKPKEWDKGKGKLLKDLVSIANSADEKAGYLVIGVRDNGTTREVVGISRSWDDATFQEWVQQAFAPPIIFSYSQLEWESGKIIGIFRIEHVAEYPHVATQTIGGVIHEGQVWFRRGSKNSIALHEELGEMFRGQEPIQSDEFDGEIVKKAKKLYEAQGYQISMAGLYRKHDMLAKGYKIAHYPGTRREIWVGYNHSKRDFEHILMLKPKK